MANKSDELKKAIKRLENSIEYLEKKLEEIDTGYNTDPSMAPVYIEQKDKAIKMLSDKVNELNTEKENSRKKGFGSGSMNAPEIARLSVGGSLKTSSLDKGSLSEDTRKEIIDKVYKNEPDDKERARQLLKEGIIVQRKM